MVEGGILFKKGGKMKGYKLLGTFGVDTGQVLITDPCYLSKFKSDKYKEGKKEQDYSYSGCCAATINSIGGTVGKNYDGVVSKTGVGDGI